MPESLRDELIKEAEKERRAICMITFTHSTGAGDAGALDEAFADARKGTEPAHYKDAVAALSFVPRATCRSARSAPGAT